MDRKEWKVGEEGSVPISRDKADRRVRDRVSHLGVIPLPLGGSGGIERIIELAAASEVRGEPLSTRRVVSITKMPLPGEEGGIVSRLESFRQSHLFEGELVLIGCRLELPSACPADKVGDACSRRSLASQDARPGR